MTLRQLGKTKCQVYPPKDCLSGKGSDKDKGPCAACQTVRYESMYVSVVQDEANKIYRYESMYVSVVQDEANKIYDKEPRCSQLMPAVYQRKHLSDPITPYLIGRSACNQCFSEMFALEGAEP